MFINFYCSGVLPSIHLLFMIDTSLLLTVCQKEGKIDWSGLQNQRLSE